MEQFRRVVNDNPTAEAGLTGHSPRLVILPLTLVPRVSPAIADEAVQGVGASCCTPDRPACTVQVKTRSCLARGSSASERQAERLCARPSSAPGSVQCGLLCGRT